MSEQIATLRKELAGKASLLDDQAKFQELEDAVINMVKASVGGQALDVKRQALLRDIFGGSVEKVLLDLHSAKALISSLVVIVMDQLNSLKK